ncbi:M1 family metallopeptidase [Sphingomonas sp.]|uniref:M1 family metallopeptidase n=1 Tax=Sphingomonas sp. TaxID=28214 RepID=UPI002DD69DF9|nr:M1 family metallopeptidase [Sphingomonas sp.]
MILAAAAAALAAATPAAAEAGKPPITAQTARSGGPLDPDQAKLALETVDLAIELFPARAAIAGTATLAFTAKQAVSRLPIDLDRNLPVSAISIDGRPLPRGAWENPEGRLFVNLPAPIAAGRRFAVTIAYGGTPHVAVRAPWDGGFVWTKTPDGRPWIATAVQGEGCDLFWPCIDSPTFEPARMDLRITVPKGLKAPSNGRLKGVETLPDGRTTWHWSVARPNTYAIALNVAPYEELTGTYRSRFGNSYPLQYWYLPGDEAKARGLFAELAPMLDFYESVVGPYPFPDEKVGIVHTPHLGMEHQTINAYGNAYKKAPEGFDWLLHHELAHEWFGNQLTASDWDDMWLHEGYGQYMQPLYGRWREGDARYLAMMLKQREQIMNRVPIVTGTSRTTGATYFDRGNVPDNDVYVKGSWILHTLRELIGDAAFWEVTRRAVYGRPDPKPGNFAPRFGSTAEYRRLVDQVTGGSYGWFFDVYLNAARPPELIEARDGDRLTLGWKVAGDNPFSMPIDVAVDGKVTRLAMEGGRDSLTLPAGAHVVIDPMARVLRRDTAMEAVRAQARR